MLKGPTVLPVPCLHIAGQLEKVVILRVVILKWQLSKRLKNVSGFCVPSDVCLCACQALLSDIASKEQEVQKVSATAQQYQQAVKVRTVSLLLGELT